MIKRTLMVFAAVLLLVSLATRSFAAGGAGPPAGTKVGEFTAVNLQEGTVSFKAAGSKEIQEVKLNKGTDPGSVPLNTKVMLTLDKVEGKEVVREFSRMFIGMTSGNIIALLVVGFIGGLLSGFIGSGGAFVLTPSMMSLGVPGAVAVASNMCHKFPKAMVGGYKRWKYGQADLKLGIVMASSAAVGVQIGIMIQKAILHAWGNAGSNLYVSLSFVIILVVVGAYVFMDAAKLARGGAESKTTKLALWVQTIKIPPVMHFKTARLTLSFWVTVPVGILTGMLAATIAVGGFIGVPGMIYVLGATAIVASATELIIAFVMGLWGSIQWAIAGLVDIRLTLLILAASVIGVQLGALGTTYVKDYIVKVVMGTVMLIVAISRGAKVPGYLADVGLIGTLSPTTTAALEAVSFWALVAALAVAGLVISGVMLKEMTKSKAQESLAAEAAN